MKQFVIPKMFNAPKPFRPVKAPQFHATAIKPMNEPAETAQEAGHIKTQRVLRKLGSIDV